MAEAEASSSAHLATQIVIAYLQQRALEPQAVVDMVTDLMRALDRSAPQPPEAASVDRPPPQENPADEPRPAVPVEESITDDFIFSLEDGMPYRSLRRHLMAKYGLTPEEYRTKWALPADYPMVAPNYARDRSEVAKRSGLGRKKRPEKRSSPA